MVTRFTQYGILQNKCEPTKKIKMVAHAMAVTAQTLPKLAG